MLHLETGPRPSLDLHGFREAPAFGCAHSRVATERASRVRDRNRSLPASTGTCAAPDLAPGHLAVRCSLSPRTQPPVDGKPDPPAGVHAFPDCGRDPTSQAARWTPKPLLSRSCLKTHFLEFSDSQRGRSDCFRGRERISIARGSPTA